MTSLQREVSRRLPEVDCTAQFDEESGRLNIDYEGTRLLSLHKDNILSFREENHQPKERLAQYYKVNDLIHKAAEYVYAYDAAPPMEPEGVSEYRRLASYNGVVLAGTENEKYGYMFTTWFESANRKYLDAGDYSPNYDYAKESFVTRSGLIDKTRLFSDEQLKTLHHCLSYMAENDESLTYEQEQKLRELMQQIGCVVHEVNTEEGASESFQQNL